MYCHVMGLSFQSIDDQATINSLYERHATGTAAIKMMTFFKNE